MMRFPLYAFNPRHRMPTAYRSAAVLCWLMSNRHVRAHSRPSQALHYVSMCGRDEWALMRESLLSVWRTWSRVPDRVTIVSDGSWSTADGEAHFRAIFPGVDCASPAEIHALTERNGREWLSDFAKRAPLNLKLAAIHELASLGRIMFVDSDVLWFRAPARFAGDAVGTESKYSYNLPLLEKSGAATAVLGGPGINSGLVLANGPLMSDARLKEAIDAAAQLPAHNFTEQTIIAIAAVEGRWNLLSQSAFECRFDDKTSVWTSYFRPRPCAIHRVGWIRHQFWRDAALALVFKRPRLASLGSRRAGPLHRFGRTRGTTPS